MKRISIWRRVFFAAAFMLAAVLSLGGGKGEAADAPRLAGQEEVIYMGGRDDISVIGADIKNVAYSSSDPRVVSVSGQGIVLPTGQGTARITAKVSYGKEGMQSKELSYSVKVLDDAAKYFVFSEGDKLSIKKLTKRGAGLKEIHIPGYYKGKKIDKVYCNAIPEHNAVEKIFVGDNVECISYDDFEGDDWESDILGACSNVREIHIGRDLKYWGGLYSDAVVEKITVDTQNPYMSVIDNVLYSKAGYKGGAGHLFYYPKGKTDKTYSVREGTKVIRSYAFIRCRHLAKVELPSTLMKIESMAFAYGSLEEVDIPAKTELEYYVFGDCKKLRKVTLPEEVKSGNAVFEKCAALQTVILPNTARSCYASNFKGCPKLERFQVKEGEGDFEARDGVLFQKSNNALMAYPMGKKDASYSVPEDVKNIADDAFQCASHLKRLTLGKSVKKVGEYAFYDCKSLKEIRLNKALTHVGVAAFSGCQSLEDIHFYKNVKYIGMDASEYIPPFEECRKLKKISVDSGNKYYASVDGVLLNKSKKMLYRYPCSKKRKNYVLPKTVKEIKDNAFCGTRYLQSVKMGDQVKKMGYHVFSDSTALRHIKLSRKLKDLGYGVFAGCKRLQKVVVPDRIRILWNTSFSQCKSLKEVVIGKGVEHMDSDIFQGCRSMQKLRFRGKLWRRWINDDSEEKIFQKVGCKNYKKFTVYLPKCTNKQKANFKKTLRGSGLHKKAKIKFQ